MFLTVITKGTVVLVPQIQQCSMLYKVDPRQRQKVITLLTTIPLAMRLIALDELVMSYCHPIKLAIMVLFGRIA